MANCLDIITDANLKERIVTVAKKLMRNSLKKNKKVTYKDNLIASAKHVLARYEAELQSIVSDVKKQQDEAYGVVDVIAESEPVTQQANTEADEINGEVAKQADESSNSQEKEKVKQDKQQSPINIIKSVSEARPFDNFDDVRKEAITAIKEQTGKDYTQHEELKGTMLLDRVSEAIHDGRYAGIRKYAASLPVNISESAIPMSVAVNAHHGTSFSPEKRGESDRRSYVVEMVSLWRKLEKAYQAATPEIQSVYEAKFQEIAGRYAGLTVSYLQSHSRVMSSMITGPANFPTRRNEKANRATDNKLESAVEYYDKAEGRLRKILRGRVDNFLNSELVEQEKKLENLKANQVKMKAINVALRKGNDQALRDLGYGDAEIAKIKAPDYSGRIGIPSYQLTNNNANIKRVEERVADLKKRIEAADSVEASQDEEQSNQPFRMVQNAAENRVQLFFDGKPDEETRNMLKAAAFKWTPSQGAWQRQLTGNAVAKAQEIAKKLTEQTNTKYSRTQSATGSTVADIKSWLPRRVQKLVSAGKIRIDQSTDKGKGVEAYYDQANDVIVLISDNLTQDKINSTLAHELVHRGLTQDEKLQAAHTRFESYLKGRFNAAKKGLGTAIEKEAYQRVVNAETPAKDQLEEFSAYLVTRYEQNPDSITGVLRKAFNDFVASIRAFLIRNGLDLGFIKTLTPADLAAMSKYGASIRNSGIANETYNKVVSGNLQPAKASTKAMPETITINGKEIPTRNSEGRLIHQTEEGIKNFYKWFGDSNKPYVYHDNMLLDDAERMLKHHSKKEDYEFRIIPDTMGVTNRFAIEGSKGGFPSVTVDASGRPMVFYHASSEIHNILNPSMRSGKLIYVATSEKGAKKGAGKGRNSEVSELYVSAKRPFNTEKSPIPWSEAESLGGFFGGDYLRENGFDSVWVKDESGVSLAVIDSNQIKSATTNTGEFNQDNQDIRFSQAPDQKSSLWNRWFGKSKMVSKGEPIKFYHGSNEDFTVFDKSKLSQSTRHATAQLGHFFTRNRDEAYQYGGKVHEVFLSMQNPYVVTSDLLDKRMGNDPAKFSDKLKAQNYDGIWIKDANYAVIFDSNQAKLTSNKAPTFGGDIRFSIAQPNLLAEDLSAFKKQAPESVMNKLDKAKSSAKDLGFSALTQRQLVELMSEILPMAKRFIQERNNYDTTESKWHQMGDDIAKKWESLAPGRDKVTWGTGAWGAWKRRNQKAQQDLADIMHEMTTSGVDPRLPEPRLNKEKTNGIAIALHRRMKAKYDQLIPEAKKVLDDAGKFHQNVTQELIQSVSDKIVSSEMPDDKKAKLIQDITDKFKTVKGPYFPLMRFGEYWLDSADGVEAFESQRELNKRIEELKKEGKRIKGYGKALENFHKIEGVDAGFINKVTDLVDTLDVDKADALKDGIFQLYLTALPEQAMRKRFIHRKGTPGYEKDALRSFAKKSFHDGKQLAKLQYAPKMKQVLDDMEEVIKTGNSSGRKEALENSIKLIPEWLDLLDNGVEYDQLSGMFPKDKDLFNRFSNYTNEDEREKVMGDYLEHAEYIMSQVEAYQKGGRKHETAADLMKYLRHSYANMMESSTHPITNLINQTVFTYFLGFSPSSAIINYLQTPGVALPLIAGRHGMVKSSRAMADAAKIFFTNKDADGHSILPGLTDKGEKEMYKSLEGNGTFDRTRSHDLAGFSEEGVKRGTLHRDFMLAATTWFHAAEVANREITALMAYRLEFAKTGNVTQSIEYANDVVNNAHLDYSSANRPDLFSGNAARVMLQFKMYSQGMTYLWGKTAYDAMLSKDVTPERKSEARRILMSMVGVQVTAAGVLGLPIGGLLMAAQMLLNMIDDDDEPKDVEVEIQKALSAVMGPDISRIISRGVLSETGADIQGRLSLSDLWIREPDRELEGKDANYYLLKTLFGPMSGIMENMAIGMKMIGDGEAQRGWETMLPNSIKGAAKAVRMLDQGGATSMQGNMIYETNAWEKALQSIGFRPSGLAVQQAQNSAIKNREFAITNTKQKLVNKAARYKMRGDNEAFKDVWEEIQEFNKKYPQMQINMGTIMKSIKARNAASRKAEDGIVVRPKLRFVRDEEDFS